MIESQGDAVERLGGLGAPSSVALFAESSGAALAMGMMTRRTETSRTLPGAVVMASPWLDMTCAGNSYVANEKKDLVMQRKRMLGIARAYLVDVNPASPDVSPLFAPPTMFAGMPPTLIQVGVTEVLLDDARALRQKATDAGCDVRRRREMPAPSFARAHGG